jgi:hypothetical protein
MGVDINGKGFLVGSTVSVTGTVNLVLNQLARVKLPSGAHVYTNSPKTSVSAYAVGSTPTLSGTVIGFTNGGLSCTIQEADGNLISALNSTVVAT